MQWPWINLYHEKSHVTNSPYFLHEDIVSSYAKALSSGPSTFHENIGSLKFLKS